MLRQDRKRADQPITRKGTDSKTMETKTAAVSMRNVKKTFGYVVANKHVDLDIYKGEILALLG